MEDDDVPTLSEHTLNALREFLKEQECQTAENKLPEEDWSVSPAHLCVKNENYREEIEQGKSHSQVSRERNIPWSTISTIFKNKFAIKSAFLKSNFSPTLKRDRDVEFPEIEEALFRWIRQANAMKLAINGNILKEKPILLALKMGQDNFEASNGWLEKFKARRNIAFKRLHGEAGSVDANSVATWKCGIIPSLLAKYSPQDIFNADETGLFYKLLPNRTMTIRGEKCEGGKKSKERITVLVCCNIDGSEKLPLLYIGKYRRPQCFHGMNIPSNYHFNKKAWMTGAIFTDWLKKLDQIFKRRERKILLILDNCPAHQIPEGLQNIEIRFLPALTTSALQPCDMGFVMDEAMEEVVDKEMNRCFEALKKHQAIDANYIDFLKVDKDVQVAGEQSIEEIVKEVMGKEDEENKKYVQQLSQFWYSASTATILAQEVMRLVGEKGSYVREVTQPLRRVACISCPTIVQYLHKLNPPPGLDILNLEYDRRFEGPGFVFYDYQNPLELDPPLAAHSCDIVLADPPFLSAECLSKVAETVRYLARDKIIICTGAVMEENVCKILGLTPCRFQPTHERHLGNEFKCYANYNLDEYIAPSPER
ncbi:TIGD4 [Cordylochernes scorpioides]|uniref:Protein-lysine N-methyltransferase LAZ67_2006022 n=1 Tax=Cordylochernes scorpioides TaxID=51811 RepID=A0ABY6K5U1_9ARAC|nr:TIGD4 [Cordylochernes scorpioides]